MINHHAVKEENHKIRRQGQGQRDGATFCFLETRVVVEVIVVLALATFCDVGLQDFCFSFNRLCSSFDLCASLNFCLSSTTSTQFRKNVFTVEMYMWKRYKSIPPTLSSFQCNLWHVKSEAQSFREVLTHFVINMHISYYASWRFFFGLRRMSEQDLSVILWIVQTFILP